MIDKIRFWSLAHNNISVLQECSEYSEGARISDSSWFRYLATKTPNGALLKRNILYNIVQQKKVYLAHVTKNFKSLHKTKKLLSSSGCLVGSVYCTPVIEDRNGLRLHNLGEYIFSREAPKFSKNEDDVALLLIELELPRTIAGSSMGIDYLKLGLVHFSVFSELSYLLSCQELESLERSTVYSIRKSSDLLAVVEKFTTESINHNFQRFYRLYQKAVIDLPILGYFLFEVFCEYIALFQRGEEVDRHNSIDELYCQNFKDLIFSVCPDLTRSFNLGLFHPNIKDVIKYLEKISIVDGSDTNLFEQYLVERLCYLIKTRFYYTTDNEEGSREAFWQNMEWNFNYIQQQLTPLLGHTVHRLLRNMHRYPTFYFYFDQYKALQAWNYWNHMGIALPYNAVLPKGEIGINPAYPDLRYQIFTTKLNQENGHSYVTKQQKLQITIEPRLAELDMMFMRNKPL